MRDVRYARAADGTHVAYQVLDPSDAEAARNDIVLVLGGLVPIEFFDQEPGARRLLEGITAFGRAVIFDRRGLGLSDPVADWSRPIVDQWADDLAAVVAAAGSTNAVVFTADGYGVGSRFAVAHPAQVRALLLFHPMWLSDSEYDVWRAARHALIRRNVEGEDRDFIAHVAPSRADDSAFRAWYDRAGRAGASPATAARIFESIFESRPHEQLFEQLTVPTFVLYRRGITYTPLEAVRAAAARIPNARLIELDGIDQWPFVGDVDAVVAEVGAIVVGERRVPPPERVLAAIMFTDLVGSTERAAALGDARWRSLLDRHDDVVRASVSRCGGTVVKTTGDGVLALLPSAGTAITAAQRLRRELAAEGLGVYIGIHVGDVDRRGDDISGLGVNIAARAMGVAAPGEIVVTGVARGAVAGTAIAFEPLGSRVLKGVPGEWDLARVVDPRADSDQPAAS